MRRTVIYRALLYCYPAAFRHEYGDQMLHAFSEQLRETKQPAALCLRAVFDALTIAPKEHLHVIQQDVRYALRTLAVSRSFAAVAILTLALGIGANTALFSLWYGLIHSALPVSEPAQLVMFSNPEASGVSIGLQTGERNLITYEEYEQLRDQVLGLAGVMASQASLPTWRARVEGSAWEDVQGRLVSRDYFQVLGVSPLAGRTFDGETGRAPAPYVVLGYDFWQRRFGGSTTALGQTITIREARLTIVGIMPPGFSGETAGQRPDLWVPLTMQPGVLPGRDWLHDPATDKVMWLHLFARLQRGTTLEQAEAQANAVFRANLERHYGSQVGRDPREDPLDQRLRIHPAANGASDLRSQFANPLTVLLIAVGVVLLIACANLANLLLARGAARQPEIALRLSLGASRGRIVRQLITENFVVSALGGACGIVAAYFLYQGLAGMIVESEPNFKMAFRLDPLVLAFTLAVTLAAALLCGLLPAWQATRAPSRFARRAPWGRVLVSVQLALSLPLLLGAGLLARTLYNLQQVDLGYPADRVLVLRVDTQSAGYDHQRSLALAESLRSQFLRIPGVAGASYSRNGVFGGRISGDDVEVEGYLPLSDNDRYSMHDMVGPRFVSSLGIPMAVGREITEEDRANGARVTVINQAFAKRFFAGRNPIGMRISNVDETERITYEIVGVMSEARMGRVRGEVPPLYYVPATQPLSNMDAVMFSIRTTGETASVLTTARDLILNADDSLTIVWARSVAERIGEQLVQDRVTARVAVVFGGVAMVLAAIGLYGVLSYGIARRSSELAIRIALGARPSRMIAMLLRETGGLILAGLVVGAGLAYGAARLIASQLYGLAPNDPSTAGAAIGILLLIALAAAYLPARRASRLDPMIALRRE